MKNLSIIKLIILAVALTTLLICPITPKQSVNAVGESVSVWVTTGSQSNLLQQQADITFGSDTTQGLLVHVNENHTYQEMDGFGAAMTDSSAWLIANALNTSQRDTLMNNLFNPTTGAGFSYVRLPMGASDFALSQYTYNDMPPGQTDPNLTNFSIAHDQAYIIPVMQQAVSLNPNLQGMGTPWSAPGWMKSTDSLIKGSLLPQYYGAYADYFVSFIQAYQAEGIPIKSVTIQNEPHHTPSDYPGMHMDPDEQASFIKNNLGPTLSGTTLNTEIIVWDHNWSELYYPVEVLDDAAAKPYIDGSAFHCYGGVPEYQLAVRTAHPDKKIHFTECSSGAWATNWSDNLVWDVQNLIIGSIRNWSSSVLKWNMALDENYGPHTGGCSNCTGIVTINQSTGAVTYNHDYYALAHVSKFVQPGAYRIASSNLTNNDIHTVAFKNPDGSKVLLALNTSRRSQTFKVRWGGQSLQYSLEKASVATFVWSGTQGEPSAPSTVSNLVATADDGQVNLSWDFSHLASSYNVKRATASGGPYSTIASSVLPEYTDTNVNNGTTYYYIITAVNSSGESGNSSVASATPNVALPFDAFSTIEAEDFDAQKGIGLESCSDTGGGENLAYLDEDDYLRFDQVDFGAGISDVSVRVASGSTGGSIEFHLDSPTGPLLGTVTVNNTGGWQNWSTNTATASGASGIQTLYVVFKGVPPADGIANFNWFKFTPCSSGCGTVNTPTPTPTPTAGNTPTPTPTSANTATPTPTPSSGSAVHVALIFSSDSAGNSQNTFNKGDNIYWRVQIVDENNNPVSNATVRTDVFKPDASMWTNQTTTTGADGFALFTKRSKAPDPVGIYTIEVTSVTKDGATYDPNANVASSTTFTLQ